MKIDKKKGTENGEIERFNFNGLSWIPKPYAQLIDLIVFYLICHGFVKKLKVLNRLNLSHNFWFKTC